MSISQLDDPSMREALGIENDNPSALTSPVTIGSVELRDLGSGILRVDDRLSTLALQLGDSPATTQGSLAMSASGQLQFNHTLPLTSAGTQTLFRPTFCEALSTVDTPVGGTGQVILPFNLLPSVSSQGGVPHFAIVGGNSVQLSATNADVGLFFVTAAIAIDTATAGQQLAVAHFKKNGVDVSSSASSHSVNSLQQNSIIIQAYIQLQAGDAVSIALSSSDAALTATTYPAAVGPPTIPVECAVTLLVSRIA